MYHSQFNLVTIKCGGKQWISFETNGKWQTVPRHHGNPPGNMAQLHVANQLPGGEPRLPFGMAYQRPLKGLAQRVPAPSSLPPPSLASTSCCQPSPSPAVRRCATVAAGTSGTPWHAHGIGRQRRALSRPEETTMGSSNGLTG